jgi:hypothetical protein
MSMSNKEGSKDMKDDEVEELLDKLWENWASRRKCEKTHQPYYLQKKEETQQKE